MKIERISANLIKYEVGAAVAVEDMQALAAMLEERLISRQPFGLMMARDGEHKENPAAAKWRKGWVKKNKTPLQAYCVGVAMVTNSAGLLKLYKPLAKMMISKMFGCAGEMFATESEAIAWLNVQMEKAAT